MPSVKFYGPDAVEDDGQLPVVTIAWGIPGNVVDPSAKVNGLVLDRSGLNRMIKALRKARDQLYGADA